MVTLKVRLLPLVEFNKDPIKQITKITMPNVSIVCPLAKSRWFEREIKRANGIIKITQKRKKEKPVKIVMR